MSFAEALTDIAQRSIEYSEADGNTVRGEDGLLYCRICGQPRQMEIELPFGDVKKKMTVGCICECVTKRNAEEKAAIADYERKLRIERNIKSSGLSPTQRSFKFETAFRRPGNSDALSTAKIYAENFETISKRSEGNKGILFCGRSGSGKTFIASCIANELLKSGYRVIIKTANELVSDLEDRESERETLKKFAAADLLIIDDLGAERKTTFTAERIFSAVEARQRENKPIVAAAALSPEAMENERDELRGRTYSRILRQCRMIRLLGDDFRRYKA